MSIRSGLDEFYLLGIGHRYTALEGLRALAVILVFNVHFMLLYYQDHYFTEPGGVVDEFMEMLHAGNIGVDIFFVISGYLILKTIINNNPSFMEYMRHRVLRIMPAHVAIVFWVALPDVFVSKFFNTLFFIPGFMVDGGYYSYNYVSWSLSYEWLYYLIVFPVIVITKKGNIYTSILVITVLLFGIEALFVTSLQDAGIEFPSAARVSCFFIGSILAAIEAKNPKVFKYLIPVINKLAVPALCFIFLACWLWSQEYVGKGEGQSVLLKNIYYLSVGLCAGVLLVHLSNSKGVLFKIFSIKIFRAIGQISYSFYLCHVVIAIPLSINVMNKIFNQVDSIGLILLHYLVALVFTIIIGSLLFYYFERPYFMAKKTS